MENKKNCWEIKKCGREPGGTNENEFGTCPASIEKKANGMNSGFNGGRDCWAIAGTMCNGVIQGTFAKKYKTCVECEHYQQVIQEERGIALKMLLMSYGI